MKLYLLIVAGLTAVSGEMRGSQSSLFKSLQRRGGEEEAIVQYHDWDKLQADIASAEKLVVLDFTARWCTPCRAIAPSLMSFAAQMGDQTSFYKIDVDEVPEASMHYDVTALPTFIVLRNGKELERFEGASILKLKKILSDNGCSVPSNDLF